MFVLIAYDISDDKRRKKVYEILSSEGVRVNYSLFEIFTSKSRYLKLIKALDKISSKRDSIKIYILNRDSINKSFDLKSDIKPFDIGSGYV